MPHAVTRDNTDVARANKQKFWVWRLPNICRQQTSMVYPFVCTSTNMHETANVSSYDTNWHCELNHSRANSLSVFVGTKVTLYCRSQWPHGLRRRSATARLLRSWVRILPEAWMFVCCECCVLSGKGLCDELITRPEESYRLWCVVVCDLETSRRRRPWPVLGRSATANKKINK